MAVTVVWRWDLCKGEEMGGGVRWACLRGDMGFVGGRVMVGSGEEKGSESSLSELIVSIVSKLVSRGLSRSLLSEPLSSERMVEWVELGVSFKCGESENAG